MYRVYGHWCILQRICGKPQTIRPLSELWGLVLVLMPVLPGPVVVRDVIPTSIKQQCPKINECITVNTRFYFFHRFANLLTFQRYAHL